MMDVFEKVTALISPELLANCSSTMDFDAVLGILSIVDGIQVSVIDNQLVQIEGKWTGIKHICQILEYIKFCICTGKSEIAIDPSCSSRSVEVQTDFTWLSNPEAAYSLPLDFVESSGIKTVTYNVTFEEGTRDTIVTMTNDTSNCLQTRNLEIPCQTPVESEPPISQNDKQLEQNAHAIQEDDIIVVEQNDSKEKATSESYIKSETDSDIDHHTSAATNNKDVAMPAANTQGFPCELNQPVGSPQISDGVHSGLFGENANGGKRVELIKIDTTSVDSIFTGNTPICEANEGVDNQGKCNAENLKEQCKSSQDHRDSNDAPNPHQYRKSTKSFLTSKVKSGTKSKCSKQKVNSNQCPYCPFQTTSRLRKEAKRNIQEHIQRLHEPRGFECNVCGHKFGTHYDLSKHSKSHKKPQYQCGICGKEYRSRQCYSQHKKSHDQSYVKPRFLCPQCHKSFTNKYVMNKHIKVQHQGIRQNVLCSLCGKSFSCKGHLNEHLNMHTGNRPYSCKVCGKSFAYSGSLLQHKLMHSDTKNHQCEICGKRFKMRASFAAHKQLHKGVRDFECDVCKKRFTQKQAMLRHHRIHSGEKPFECPVCKTRFKDLSVLRRHLLGRHKRSKEEWKSMKIKPTKDNEIGDQKQNS